MCCGSHTFRHGKQLGFGACKQLLCRLTLSCLHPRVCPHFGQFFLQLRTLQSERTTTRLPGSRSRAFALVALCSTPWQRNRWAGDGSLQRPVRD
jgi:hypothetical protein